ncbi:MAG: hypothetical protein ICV73_11835 [Acetobacteraceae bacterium]|nr:hypothetical protein [Acetobacteraceae bacterium]
MRLARILALSALLGFCWAVPAQAAGDRRPGASAHAAAVRPGQQIHTERRKGHHASAAASRRRHRAPAARLTPGREVIDHSGRPQRRRASYSGRQFNGRKMANGRPFDPNPHPKCPRSRNSEARR